ncbi:hypothetical protein ACLB1N_15840 [Escherichia coli]
MKLVHMASGLAVAIALAACADKSADIQTPARLQIRLFQQHNLLSSNRMSPVPSGSGRKSHCRLMLC